MPARLQPAASSRRDLPLVLLTLAACGASIAALLLHWLGWVAMPYAVSFVTLPGMVLLVALTGWARRENRRLLVNRIVVGAQAGLLGLVAYDLVRLLAQVALPLNFQAFRSMDAFGHFMTGLPLGSAPARVAGWAYHVSNGLTFAIAYSVVAGPARWWWGLIFGTALQLGMTAVYPTLFEIESIPSFLVVSVIGHAVYGSVIGVWCERRALPAPGRVKLA
ncbi:MAG: hypothetical protein HY658_00015 [Actinobacteria bacterium]|nr:hypothetical protein [Actinomycetota bacterium]